MKYKLILLLAVLIGTVACKKDEDKADGRLVGTWTTTDFDTYQTKLTVESNLNYSYKISQGSMTGGNYWEVSSSGTGLGQNAPAPGLNEELKKKYGIDVNIDFTLDLGSGQYLYVQFLDNNTVLRTFFHLPSMGDLYEGRYDAKKQ